MKVLVVGGGGREHALAWKIAQSPEVDRVLAAPGSDAMSGLAECFPAIAAGDLEGLVSLARRESVDLAVVGPEDPLVASLADRLREAGVATFGPSAGASSFTRTGVKRWRRRVGSPSCSSAGSLRRVPRACPCRPCTGVGRQW